MEVTPGKTVLLTESAEEVSQIDLARAEESRKRAQERLALAAGKEVDKGRAKAALERAVNRLKIAQKYKK
jgi:F-type H+-transporting ATPase subunit epsilon